MDRRMRKLNKLLRVMGVSVMLFSSLTSMYGLSMAGGRGLEYRQDISPSMGAMLAPELMARLKEGDKVVLVVNGEGWRDFDRPEFIKVNEGKDGDYNVVVEKGVASDARTHFVVMRNGDWLGFVHETDTGKKKMALMADGNMVDVTKDFIDRNKKSALSARDELWWGIYAYMNYHGAEGIVTKLVSKGTTGFLRASDKGRSMTTAMFDSYPAAYFEGAMINIVELDEKDGAGKNFVPGFNRFSYNPRLHSYRFPTFDKKWKLGTKGNGWVKFRAKAKSDIRVYLSAIIENDPENSLYCCSIGEKENSFSAFREKANSVRKDDAALSDPASFEVDKGQDPGVVIQKPDIFNDYWFKVQNGELSWGTGKVVGQEIKMSWKDPSPLNDVKYVAFGGLNDPVQFEGIEISPPVVEKPKVNLPDGYAAYAQAGTVDSITVGSNNGALFVWGIQKDRLVKWNTGSKKFEQDTTSGLPATGKVQDVAAGGDGTVYTIVDDVLYRLKDDKWEVVSTSIWSVEDGAVVEGEKLVAKSLAVGNADNVWALAKEGTKLYQLMTAQQGDESQVVWVQRSEFATKVSAGLDNSAAAIDNQGFAYLFISGQWVNISNEREFHKLAVVTKDHIIAIGRDMMLYEYRSATGDDGVYLPGDWVAILGVDKKPAFGLHKLAVNASGTAFATDAAGVLYSHGDAGVSQAIVDSLAKAVPPIVAPEAQAEVAPGESAANFLVQLEAMVVQLEGLRSLFSQEDVTRIQEIGGILTGIKFEEKDIAEKIVEEQAASQDVDTPPSKEEQVQEQVVEATVEEEIEQVIEEKNVIPTDSRGRPLRSAGRGRGGRGRGGSAATAPTDGTTRDLTVRTSTSGRGMTRGGRSQSRAAARSVRGATPPVASAVDAAAQGEGVVIGARGRGGRGRGGGSAGRTATAGRGRGSSRRAPTAGRGGRGRGGGSAGSAPTAGRGGRGRGGGSAGRTATAGRGRGSSRRAPTAGTADSAAESASTAGRGGRGRGGGSAGRISTAGRARGGGSASRIPTAGRGRGGGSAGRTSTASRAGSTSRSRSSGGSSGRRR